MTLFKKTTGVPASQTMSYSRLNARQEDRFTRLIL